MNYFVGVWSELWKSRERESAMMFPVPLMCCEYRYVSLLMSFHLIQCTTALLDYAFTGSKDALCIQTSAMGMSVNAKMCDPCPIFRMFIYIFTVDASNSRRFNMSFPCHAEVIIHSYARPLLLQPPIPHSQASDHSVTDGLTKNMLFIGTPLLVTCWRIFIHSWRYSRCHSWGRFSPHSPPLFSKWHSRFKRHHAVRMTYAALFSFPINDY